MTYTFDKSDLVSVIDHTASLDIQVESLTLEGTVYTMVTASPLPDEQVEHLNLTVA